jgi:stress response protein YsnF
MAAELPPGEAIIPVAEETIAVSKRQVELGKVRVSLTTDVEQMVARETLRGRRVEVERIAVGRTLAEGETPPQTREDGDTLIIPVVEEVAVVVKRLVLREELRLRFIQTEVPFEQEVDVRRQRATVQRLAPDGVAPANQTSVASDTTT